MRKPNRIEWAPVVARAAQIVMSYDTGVTLRQLFYRLVSEEMLPNTHTAYQTLSARTAEARRAGGFPRLLDRTRRIHRDLSFDGPADARAWLAGIYQRDRAEGQPYAVYLGVEKHGMVEQLKWWFGKYGVRVLALGGYASQSYVDDVADDIRADAESDHRPAVLIYAGDWDGSGEDIDRDFLARCGLFAETVRVALNEDLVRRYHLPELPGKARDPRARGFEERNGRLVQVELDALAPDVLRNLYRAALDQYLDMDMYESVLEQEKSDRATLTP